MRLFGGFISATTIFCPSADRAKTVLMEDCLAQYPLEEGYINHMTGVSEVTEEQLEAYLESKGIQ